MKKGIKIAIGGFLLVIIIVVLILLLYMNTIATAGIEKVLSSVLDVEVSLEEAKISILKGTVQLRNLHIYNPEGFNTQEAFSVEDITVKADIKSFTTDKPHIMLVAIENPSITLEQGLKGSNISKLIENASAEEEEVEEVEEAEEEAGKKVRIDLVEVNGTRVGLSSPVLKGKEVTFPVPKFSIKDIGGEDEHVSIGRSFVIFFTELLKQIKNAGTGVIPSDLRDTMDDTIQFSKKYLDSGMDVLKEGGDQLKKKIDDTGKGLKSLFGKEESEETE